MNSSGLAAKLIVVDNKVEGHSTHKDYFYEGTFLKLEDYCAGLWLKITRKHLHTYFFLHVTIAGLVWFLSSYIIVEVITNEEIFFAWSLVFSFNTWFSWETTEVSKDLCRILS